MTLNRLFLCAAVMLVILAISGNKEKEACRATWLKVFGPNAREGASWNSEWNGDVTEETCGPYFDRFEK